MDVPTSAVGYTTAMPRRENHEVHKGYVVALGRKKTSSFKHATWSKDSILCFWRDTIFCAICSTLKAARTYCAVNVLTSRISFLFSWPWWMRCVVKHNMLKNSHVTLQPLLAYIKYRWFRRTAVPSTSCRPWKWWHYNSPKRLAKSTDLQEAKSQNTGTMNDKTADLSTGISLRVNPWATAYLANTRELMRWHRRHFHWGPSQLLRHYKVS